MDPAAAEGEIFEAPCIGQRLDDRAEERKRDKKKREKKGELNELSKAASLPPLSLAPQQRRRRLMSATARRPARCFPPGCLPRSVQ